MTKKVSDRWWILVVVGLFVLTILWGVGFVDACGRRGGHVSYSWWNRGVLCLSDDGRVIEP